MYTLMSKQRARFCPLQCLQTNTLNIAFIQPPYKSAQLEYVTYMNNIGIYVNCHIQTLCLPSWATLPGPNMCIVCSTLSWLKAYCTAVGVGLNAVIWACAKESRSHSPSIPMSLSDFVILPWIEKTLPVWALVIKLWQCRHYYYDRVSVCYTCAVYDFLFCGLWTLELLAVVEWLYFIAMFGSEKWMLKIFITVWLCNWLNQCTEQHFLLMLFSKIVLQERI